jgi:UPF0271 protein
MVYRRPVRIDLNADLGEGFGMWRLTEDDALLHIVTSANVACGFHAGDPRTMQRVCRTAAERGVVIGAQVGYRDLAGFGRRRIDVAADELTAETIYQIGALDGFARAAGTRVRYVKAHGALYNTAADDPVQARAVATAVAAVDRELPLLGLPDSQVAAAAADAGIEFVAEAFADRAYTPAGRLVPRGEPGAVLDSDAALAQALRIAREQRVTASGGHELTVSARSLCLHGDTAGAVQLAERIRDSMAEGGVDIEPFALPRPSPAT